MRELVVDGRFMKSKEDLYRHLTRVFSLPNYFGNNLDALWDVLTESDEQTQINIVNGNLVTEYLGAYGEKLLSLFEQLEAYENYTINFI